MPIRRNFDHIPQTRIPAFAEARTWMDKVCRGAIDPQQVLRLVAKAKRLMESRKAAARRAKRPSNFLKISGDATVRRPSGLYVPPIYKDV